MINNKNAQGLSQNLVNHLKSQYLKTENHYSVIHYAQYKQFFKI